MNKKQRRPASGVKHHSGMMMMMKMMRMATADAFGKATTHRVNLKPWELQTLVMESHSEPLTRLQFVSHDSL